MSFFKTKEIEDRSYFMCSEARAILNAMIDWLLDKGIHPIVTDCVTTKEEDDKLKRVSSTHREGRAFDLRCRDWKEDIRMEFIIHFNNLYSEFGAISQDGGTKLIYMHGEGENIHMHVQVNKKFFNKYKIAQFNKEMSRIVT